MACENLKDLYVELQCTDGNVFVPRFIIMASKVVRDASNASKCPIEKVEIPFTKEEIKPLFDYLTKVDGPYLGITTKISDVINIAKVGDYLDVHIGSNYNTKECIDDLCTRVGFYDCTDGLVRDVMSTWNALSQRATDMLTVYGDACIFDEPYFRKHNTENFGRSYKDEYCEPSEWQKLLKKECDYPTFLQLFKQYEDEVDAWVGLRFESLDLQEVEEETSE
jgi:hypothetical protein